MERFSRGRVVALLVVVVVFGLLPFVLSAGVLPEATRLLVLIGGAFALNLLVGSTGLISMGQGLVFGLGAYAVAIGTIKFHLGFWESAAIGIAASVPMALLAALISLRARHLFFGLLTMAIGQVAYVLASQGYKLTGGDEGLVGVRLPAWLDNDVAQHYFALGVLLVVALAIMRLIASPFGAMLGAVRDNPDRVASIGGNPKLFELAVMVIAGVVAAIFGVVWSCTEGAVDPNLFSWVTSTMLLMMVALGGRTMFLGPVIGAVLLEVSRAAVQKYSTHSDLVVGSLVILCAVAFPEGIGPPVVRWFQRLAGRRAVPHAQELLEAQEAIDAPPHTADPAAASYENVAARP
jgi:branched-chain amino acid transport system permease protein